MYDKITSYLYDFSKEIVKTIKKPPKSEIK